MSAAARWAAQYEAADTTRSMVQRQRPAEIALETQSSREAATISVTDSGLPRLRCASDAALGSGIVLSVESVLRAADKLREVWGDGS